MNTHTDDPESTENYGIPQWRIEMLFYYGDLLEPREQELLTNGPDSLASSWRLMGLQKEWNDYIEEFG